MKVKVKRNTRCPCASGRKYKACCEGKVDWNELLRTRPEEVPLHLTARGKNEAFLGIAFDALNLPTHNVTWSDVKHGCTARAVQEIHAAIPFLWPSQPDLLRVLRAPREGASGLYVGSYVLPALRRGVTRHSTYADRIVLLDPFPDTRVRRPKFDPMQNPERFRSATLRALAVWLEFEPWIRESLVEFVQNPGNYDLQLQKEAWEHQRRKFDEDPEFRKVVEEEARTVEDGPDEMAMHVFLSTPDHTLARQYREQQPDATDEDVSKFIEEVHGLRLADRYHITDDVGSWRPPDDLLQWSTGLAYPMARLTANLSGAHLITDLRSRWWQIEHDREARGASNARWEPLAKAFGSMDMRFLNEVPLQAALSLRKEERLASMRVFLRKVWEAAGCTDSFEDSAAKELADELQHEMAAAEKEWKAIDRRLLKWLGGAAAGALASAPVVSGTGAMLAAAVAMGTQLLGARGQRQRFLNAFPAAFFVGLKKKSRNDA